MQKCVRSCKIRSFLSLEQNTIKIRLFQYLIRQFSVVDLDCENVHILKSLQVQQIYCQGNNNNCYGGVNNGKNKSVPAN